MTIGRLLAGMALLPAVAVQAAEPLTPSTLTPSVYAGVELSNGDSRRIEAGGALRAEDRSASLALARADFQGAARDADMVSTLMSA